MFSGLHTEFRLQTKIDASELNIDSIVHSIENSLAQKGLTVTREQKNTISIHGNPFSFRVDRNFQAISYAYISVDAVGDKSNLHTIIEYRYFTAVYSAFFMICAIASIFNIHVLIGAACLLVFGCISMRIYLKIFNNLLLQSLADSEWEIVCRIRESAIIYPNGISNNPNS